MRRIREIQAKRLEQTRKMAGLPRKRRQKFYTPEEEARMKEARHRRHVLGGLKGAQTQKQWKEMQEEVRGRGPWEEPEPSEFCDVFLKDAHREIEHILSKTMREKGENASVICRQAGDYSELPICEGERCFTLYDQLPTKCPSGVPYAVVHARPVKRDIPETVEEKIRHASDLDFVEIGAVGQARIPHSCFIDVDDRLMTCAVNVHHSDLDKRVGKAEHMRMYSLVKEREVPEREVHMTQKRRLIEKYKIPVCEVPL